MATAATARTSVATTVVNTRKAKELSKIREEWDPSRFKDEYLGDVVEHFKALTKLYDLYKNKGVKEIPRTSYLEADGSRKMVPLSDKIFKLLRKQFIEEIKKSKVLYTAAYKGKKKEGSTKATKNPVLITSNLKTLLDFALQFFVRAISTLNLGVSTANLGNAFTPQNFASNGSNFGLGSRKTTTQIIYYFIKLSNVPQIEEQRGNKRVGTGRFLLRDYLATVANSGTAAAPAATLALGALDALITAAGEKINSEIGSPKRSALVWDQTKTAEYVNQLKQGIKYANIASITSVGLVKLNSLRDAQNVLQDLQSYHSLTQADIANTNAILAFLFGQGAGSKSPLLQPYKDFVDNANAEIDAVITPLKVYYERLKKATQ